MTERGDAAVTIESLPHDSTGRRFGGALALRNRLHAERDPRLDPDTAEQFRRAIAGTPTFDQELLLAIEAEEVVGLAAVHLHRVGSSTQIAELEIPMGLRGLAPAIGQLESLPAGQNAFEQIGADRHVGYLPSRSRRDLIWGPAGPYPGSRPAAHANVSAP